MSYCDLSRAYIRQNNNFQTQFPSGTIAPQVQGPSNCVSIFLSILNTGVNLANIYGEKSEGTKTERNQETTEETNSYKNFTEIKDKFNQEPNKENYKALAKFMEENEDTESKTLIAAFKAIKDSAKYKELETKNKQ